MLIILNVKGQMQNFVNIMILISLKNCENEKVTRSNL